MRRPGPVDPAGPDLTARDGGRLILNDRRSDPDRDGRIAFNELEPPLRVGARLGAPDKEGVRD